MWKLPDAAAQRFPLIARPRPACLPLTQRVHALAALADLAAQSGDPGVASTVYNQAALLASDVGMPDLARTLCRQHAAAYLHAVPLPGTTAIRALEPAVNLARLSIRAGRYDDGRERLLTLFNAVSTESPAQVGCIAIPACLTESTEDRHVVRAWLWRILLADGTRALTAAGRWSEALSHVETHRGVGQRMLDGRQVAILAALAAGNALGAANLLAATESPDPWQDAVTSCLTVLCRQAAGLPWRGPLQNLVTAYLERPDSEDLVVFNTRLGLAVLDALPPPEDAVARVIVAELHRRTIKATDGYAAHETLAHPLFTTLSTAREAQECRALVQACGLGAGSLADGLKSHLVEALRVSDQTIRESLAHPNRAGTVEQGRSRSR
ncbi:hypothetical protein [Streptomyces sp. NPDC088254]|uniref:hypothetical protein n=1 Tax=Streptomyces sp. NPDC088254 TaxID=3365847 RepID=UPI00382A37B9